MIGSIYIIDVTVELPPDVTMTPQMYKVNCIIAGGVVHDLNFSYADVIDINLTDSTPVCTESDGFTCTVELDNGDNNNGVSGLASDITPNDLRHGLLNVIWEAKEICSGVFRQDNNNGDHKIRCSAQRGDSSNYVIRYSDYITARGSNSLLVMMLYTLSSSIIISL